MTSFFFVFQKQSQVTLSRFTFIVKAKWIKVNTHGFHFPVNALQQALENRENTRYDCGL